MTKITDDKNIRLHQMSGTFTQNFKQIGGFLPAFRVKKDNFTFERNFDLNFPSLKNIIQNFIFFLKKKLI
jgi:hypothetical protein